MFAAFAANVKTMESLRRNEVKYVPGVLRIEKVIVLSAADYEKLAEDISPEYPFLKNNRTLMTAQPGGTFRCLLVTAETEQEGMLLALTENTLYAGRAQNVPGMELQGIPVERIALEEPKAYQEHAVFFHRARGLDDITGRDVHRPMPERQTSFRVELTVVLSDVQFRQFKECGLMEDQLFLFENSGRMWFDPGELCWHCLLVKGESSRDGILVEAEGYVHARYAAHTKTYLYRIHNHPIDSPFDAAYYTRVPRHLDEARMQAAAQQFVGRHDFLALCAAGSSAAAHGDTVRTITDCHVTRKGDEIDIEVTADGYLYNMVRILAGTLCEAGAGRLDPTEIPAILESRDRSRAGPTLPAKGLFLKCVEYDL